MSYIKPPKILTYSMGVGYATEVAQELSNCSMVQAVIIGGSLSRALSGLQRRDRLFGDVDLAVVSSEGWVPFASCMREMVDKLRQVTKADRLCWAVEALRNRQGPVYSSPLDRFLDRTGWWQVRQSMDGDVSSVSILDIHILPLNWDQGSAERADVIESLGYKYVDGNPESWNGTRICTWDPVAFLVDVATRGILFDPIAGCFHESPAVSAQAT
jgi:hypothetical protein